MSWIKGKDTAKLIRTLFLKEVMPVANDRQKKQINYFPLRPDMHSSTYYQERELTSMNHEDFEMPGCKSPQALEETLAELWELQGYTELIPLAHTTARLAELLRESEEESEEVSPFIYVMF